MNNNIDPGFIIMSLRSQIAQLSYDKALLDALAAQQKQRIEELETQLKELQDSTEKDKKDTKDKNK